MKTLIDIGIFLNVFFTSYVFFKTPFEFYFSYVPILILLPIFISKYKFYTPNYVILFILLVTGLFNVLIGNNLLGNFIKIYANLAVNLIFYQYVLQYYDFDVKKIFNLYLRGAVFACIIGLIQFVLFTIGLESLANFRSYLPINKWGFSKGGLGIRVNGLFCEPSYLGGVISPAFFVAIYQLVTRSFNYISIRGSFIIIATYILSASSVAYLGVFFAFVLIFINYGALRYFFIAIPVLFLGVFYTYKNSPDFKLRADGLYELYFNDVLDNTKTLSTNKQLRKQKLREFLSKVHGSSFVFYNNFQITMNNLSENPFFGTGLGSHEIAFDKFDKSHLIGDLYQNNKSDANSMLLRTASEMGLLGLVALLLILFKFYISRPTNLNYDNDYWVISNALFVLISLQYLRQGNYTFNAFFLFFWMYYYNFINYNKYQSEVAPKLEFNDNEKTNVLIKNTT